MGNYIATGESFVDPISSNLGLIALAGGAMYGYLKYKNKGTKKALMYAAIFGLAGRLAPIPTGAVIGYLEFDKLKALVGA